jgi:hypothetical protein
MSRYGPSGYYTLRYGCFYKVKPAEHDESVLRSLATVGPPTV